MAISNGQTSVSNTGQTAIVTAKGDAVVYLRNEGANSIFVGDAGVTTANGLEVAASGGEREIRLHADQTLYGQAATAATVMQWLLSDSGRLL